MTQWPIPPGCEIFLDALSDPNHPEHEELLEWYGGPFDPADMKEQIVRIQMGRLTKARIRKK